MNSKPPIREITEKQKKKQRIIIYSLLYVPYILFASWLIKAQIGFKYTMQVNIGAGILIGLPIIIEYLVPRSYKVQKSMQLTQWMARKGWAIITGRIEEDYKLLQYVNPVDAEGWINIEGQTYSPVMRGGKYREQNFLQKPNEYGEVIKKETPFEVIYLEGNHKGKVGDKRHAGFMQLEDLGYFIGKPKVEYIDKNGLKTYRVVGVGECSIAEIQREEIRTTEEFIEKVLKIAKKKIKLKGNRGILILQTKTSIETTIVILEEQTTVTN